MKNFQVTFIAVLSWLVAQFYSGCIFESIRENDLLGSYLAGLPGGSEHLVLLPDGICKQQIDVNRESYRCVGQWTYDAKTRYLILKGTHVALTGTREINPTIGEIPQGITGALPVSRSIFGKISFGSDEGIEYEKQ